MAGRRKRRLSRRDRVEIEFLEAVRRRCPGKVDVLHALGDLYTRVGRYEEGLRIDEQLVRRQPGDPYAWYNLACSHALLGQRREALAALRRAVELGYDDYEWMMQDQDLASLRGLDEFRDLVRVVKRKAQRRENADDGHQAQ